MNWKQKGPSSWTARAPRDVGGRFTISQVAGGDFAVEHQTDKFYWDSSRRLWRFKRQMGRASSLSEAQAIAQTFASDMLLWHEVVAETVPA